MGKRKSQDLSEEDIKRKIKKLEKKLEKRRVIVASSDEEQYHDDPVWAGFEPAAETAMEVSLPASPQDSPRPTTSYGCLGPISPLQQAPDNDALMSPNRDQSLEAQTCQVQCIDPLMPTQEAGSNEDALDDEILALLGDAPVEDSPLGPAIHKDIANRWREILLKGLPKEVKEKLLKDYPIPNNCEVLLAPTLNPEAKAALSDVLYKKDLSIFYKQKEIGIALSALASAMEMLIQNETSKQKILKPISDACRILCNRHHNETRVRRDFVISAINNELKEVLIDTKRDTLLFGENLSEKLRVAKSIQKSGETLRNVPRTTNRQNFPTKFNKGHLNFKPQHRKTDNKMAAARQPQRFPRQTQGFAPSRHAAPKTGERPLPRYNRNK